VAAAVVGDADETTFFDLTASPAALLEGTNIFAVEVHQANATSSDISFDLEVTGRRFAAPVLLRGQPVAANQLLFWFDAPSGVRFVIDTSADLRLWTPVHTNTAVSGRFQWLDNRTLAQRFYRARQQ